MMGSIEKYFWVKERILYILYCYPVSIFSKKVAFDLYSEIYNSVNLNNFLIAFNLLIDEGFIEIERTSVEDLKKNGIFTRKQPRFRRRLKRYKNKYILTEKGKKYIEEILRVLGGDVFGI